MSVRLTFVLAMFALAVSAQTSYKGYIVNPSLHPVAYANITLNNKKIIAAADQKGFFRFELADSLLLSPIRFSHVAYKPCTIRADSLALLLAKSSKIVLQDNPLKLAQIVITRKKLQEKAYGDTAAIAGLGLFSGSIPAGNPENFRQKLKNKTDTLKQTLEALPDSARIAVLFAALPVSTRLNELESTVETGRIIRIRNKRFWLKAAGFQLARNHYDSLLGRLNIYSVKNNKPHRPLLPQEVIFSINNQERHVRLDLSELNIWHKGPIFMSITFLRPAVDMKSIAFAIGSKTNRVFVRASPSGQWHTFDMQALAFYVTVWQ